MLNRIIQFHDALWLAEKYLSDGLSTRQIATLCEVDHKTILRWMKKHGIERRDRIDGVKLNRPHGENHPWFGLRGPEHPGYKERWTEEEKKAQSMRLKQAVKRGPESPKWKGGRTKHPHGYILVHRPGHPKANSGGYVFEHILVMEEHLGRFLNDKEVVHHINFKKGDNRTGNLKLFASTGDHTRFHNDLRRKAKQSA